MPQPHQKHPKLSRPAYGQFARHEWAILGTPCGNIHQLVQQLIDSLSANYKIGYVDADHPPKDRTAAEAKPYPRADMVWTDKINFRRMDWSGNLNAFHLRPVFNEMDAVLVNGNHFVARHQIVVIDPKKEESLSRKLDRLTDVQLILMTEQSTAIPDYLKNHLPELSTIPVLNFTETEKIAAFLEKKLATAIPPLYGLVLAGGKSQRMGTDKGLLDYHGKPQRIHLAEMLDKYCTKTWLSVRSAADQPTTSFDYLEDSFARLGPFGAIASAFREQPEAAWLVVACDLPLLTHQTLGFLVKNRNPSAIATAFQSPVNPFPEPLISIWEPKSYPILLQFLAQGYSCPRKVLINSNIRLLQPPAAEELTNVNHPEERAEIMERIGK